MSNFLKKNLSSKSSSKDLSQKKKIEEQHTASSNIIMLQMNQFGLEE